jgi:ATP-dependent RNA helicase DeaD
MVRLFIDAGRNQGVSAGDIVGAVANEGNVPGKAIGAIDVNDSFTLVDIPAEFVKQVLQAMTETKIRNQKANIRLAAAHEVSEDRPRRPRSAAPRGRGEQSGGGSRSGGGYKAKEKGNYPKRKDKDKGKRKSPKK